MSKSANKKKKPNKATTTTPMVFDYNKNTIIPGLESNGEDGIKHFLLDNESVVNSELYNKPFVSDNDLAITRFGGVMKDGLPWDNGGMTIGQDQGMSGINNYSGNALAAGSKFSDINISGGDNRMYDELGDISKLGTILPSLESEEKKEINELRKEIEELKNDNSQDDNSQDDIIEGKLKELRDKEKSLDGFSLSSNDLSLLSEKFKKPLKKKGEGDDFRNWYCLCCGNYINTIKSIEDIINYLARFKKNEYIKCKKRGHINFFEVKNGRIVYKNIK